MLSFYVKDFCYKFCSNLLHNFFHHLCNQFHYHFMLFIRDHLLILIFPKNVAHSYGSQFFLFILTL
jgi:hypothetical protein